jgi:Immunity protein 21
MEWINSAGGPLICADEDFVRRWLGVTGLSFPAVGVSSDYELACNSTAILDLINEDKRNAIVLGDEPYQSTFLEVEGRELSIARWVFAESTSLESVLTGSLDDLIEVAPRKKFEVNKTVLYLFDSGMPGAEVIEPSAVNPKGIKTHSKAQISGGMYSVTTERLQADKKYCFLLHRFIIRP